MPLQVNALSSMEVRNLFIHGEKYMYHIDYPQLTLMATNTVPLNLHQLSSKVSWLKVFVGMKTFYSHQHHILLQSHNITLQVTVLAIFVYII